MKLTYEHSKKMNCWALGLLCSTALLASQAGAITFDFRGGHGPLDGPDGNVRTFTQNGIDVTVSAWSRGGNGIWSPAYLGQFGYSGLGVTNPNEGNGRGSRHRVDNIGSNDFVLFQFSETVIPNQVNLRSVVNDSDISIWASDVTTPINLDSDTTFSDLFSPRLENNFTRSSRNRTASFNSGGTHANSLLISAFYGRGGDNYADEFKIRSLHVDLPTNVPDGGSTALMFLSILVPVFGWRLVGGSKKKQ